MSTLGEIISALEDVAPSRYAFEFDKVGLQIGDPGDKITKAVVSLDSSVSAIRFAAAQGAQLLVSHHPLIWNPLAALRDTSYNEHRALELIRNGIGFIGAHTNWDCARGGINDTLALQLELRDITCFGAAAPVKQLKLTVFAPADATDRIIDSASKAGAGFIGCYSRCAFVGSGTGTFFGSDESNPAVGKAGQREKVEENRIEMVLPASKRTAVERAVRKHHPYEEPAIDFYELEPVDEQPICRMGKLPSAVNLREFASYVDLRLQTRCWTFGDPSAKVEKVAVCGGAADDEWTKARTNGADVFVTGEVRQHIGLEAAEQGFAIIAAGHYATEHPGCESLRLRLAKAVPAVEWVLYTPELGLAGRPF